MYFSTFFFFQICYEKPELKLQCKKIPPKQEITLKELKTFFGLFFFCGVKLDLIFQGSPVLEKEGQEKTFVSSCVDTITDVLSVGGCQV